MKLITPPMPLSETESETIHPDSVPTVVAKKHPDVLKFPKDAVVRLFTPIPVIQPDLQLDELSVNIKG